MLALAGELGLAGDWLADLEVTCLLHDLGRAGMDPQLFGSIFRLAEERGVPVRLSEMRERYPERLEQLRLRLDWLSLLGSSAQETQ